MSQQQVSPLTARSPLAVVYLLHAALELPVAIQGLWIPYNLPFLDMNNTSLIILKLYASCLLGTCIAAFLCFTLPDFLPGKRAFSICLCLYHTIASTLLIQSPRFIPISFGSLAESWKFTPEVAWGSLHGIIGMLFVTWWQGTVQYAAAARNMGGPK